MNRWTKALLVALRIAVGWHFLYEGLWKVDTHTGAAAYPASWYTLQTSVARLRDYFETAPPGQLEPAVARADAWWDEIIKAFKGRNQSLAEDQKARLGLLRDKVKLAAAASARGEIAPSEVVNFDWIYLRDEVLKMPPPQESEAFSALPFLQASAGPFRGAMRGLARDIDGVERLTLASAHAAIDRRAAQVAGHYGFSAAQKARLDEVCGGIKAALVATIRDPGFETRLADYRLLRTRVAADAGSTSAPFSRERLAQDRKKQDLIAGELLAFVNEPLTELMVQALSIATGAQLAAGPPPPPGQPSDWIDRTIEWALTAIGLCLILGLFTPVAALAAAGQIALFYLASPPWPGLPAATLGGHYLYIDRNLIEIVAALLIAVTGTGRLAGLDAYWTLLRRRRQAAIPPAAEPVNVKAGSLV